MSPNPIPAFPVMSTHVSLCSPPAQLMYTPPEASLCLLLTQHHVDPRRPLHMSMEWAKEGSVSPRAQEEEAGLFPLFLVPWPWK